jgi:hypothetical protein
MANIDTYAPGSFCWFELATTDQNAAKSFYMSLFGWGVNDMPMGPNDVYSMFQLEGRSTGAAYTIRPDMRAKGVPPHWGLYIAADSADETAAKVGPAGGTLVAPPFDVFDVGRSAVVRDPAGAMFQLWQEKRPSSNGIAGVPGTFCWADLCTRDIEAAVTFYSQVFGWQIIPGENDNSGYLHIKNGETFIGGVPPSQFLPPYVPSHWMLYFYVADTDAATERVKELGGAVHMGPMTVEKVGRMSVVADPQGAAFALFTPKP